MHELNLDYILEQIMLISARVDQLIDEAIQKASEIANAYTDSQLQSIRDDFNDLSNEFDDVKTGFEALTQSFISLSGQFDDLVLDINNKLVYMRDYIDAQILAVNSRTDALFVQNNDYILSQVGQYLANVEVLNYFTGTYMSIQDMFDYLAQLHITDSIDYDTMNTRALTYTQFNALNITYTDLAMHGNTLYV